MVRIFRKVTAVALGTDTESGEPTKTRYRVIRLECGHSIKDYTPLTAATLTRRCHSCEKILKNEKSI